MQGCSCLSGRGDSTWVQTGWRVLTHHYQEDARSGGGFGGSPVTLSLYPDCRLDYSGIALLIMGSFVPWLYYSFYCSPQPRLIYLSIVCVLGISAIIVAQWDRFATPKHRQTRAGRSSPFSPQVPSPGREFRRASGMDFGKILWWDGSFHLGRAFSICRIHSPRAPHCPTAASGRERSSSSHCAGDLDPLLSRA